MGWSAKIISDKLIKEEEVDLIVNELPARFCFPLGNMKQDSGWSTAANIKKPEKNTILIGGPYGISGDIAEDFIIYIKNKLENNGHKINVTFNW